MKNGFSTNRSWLIAGMSVVLFLATWFFAKQVFPQSENILSFASCRTLVASGAPLDLDRNTRLHRKEKSFQYAVHTN